MLKAQVSEPDSGLESVRSRLYERYRSYQSAGNSDDERRQRAPYLRNLITRHFPPNRNLRILDLGCGSGALLYFLNEAGYKNLSGIDNSSEQIKETAKIDFADVTCGDVFGLLESAANESYDVIAAFDVIEHLTKPELLRFADEIYRTLAPGGLWMIHAPNAEGVFGGRVRYADLTHEQAFTRESVEQLTRAAGFSVTNCYEDEPVVHGVKSMLRWCVWKSARAILRLYYMAETGDAGRHAVFSQNLLALARK